MDPNTYLSDVDIIMLSRFIWIMLNKKKNISEIYNDSLSQFRRFEIKGQTIQKRITSEICTMSKIVI